MQGRASFSTWRWAFSALSLLMVEFVHEGAALADKSSTTPEQGYDLGEAQGARELGMAGALNALGVSNTALRLNPANMPLARVYHIEALATLIPEARRQSYGAGVVDSILNKGRLAGGATVNWSLMDPDGIHRSWTDVRAGLAYPFGDRLSMGITGRYLRVDQAVAAGPFGRSLASDGTPGQPLFNQVTFDVGATLTISQLFRAGLVGHNLTNPGTGLAPTTLAGGIGVITKNVQAEAGSLIDFTTFGSAKWRAMLGGELFVADHFAFRLGYRFDQGTRAHALSTGFGYIDKKWGLELGARRDIVSDHPSTVATLSFKFFYNAVLMTGGGDEGSMAEGPPPQ